MPASPSSTATIVGAAEMRFAGAASDRAQTYSVSADVVAEDPVVIRQAPRRIEHDPQRARAR